MSIFKEYMIDNPILVEKTRGGIPESPHRGAFAISDEYGKILYSAGNIEKIFFPRSSYKMLQAILLVESGAADHYNLSNKHLSLACASHNGEETHTNLVKQWLELIGLEEHHLACGPHRPFDINTTDTLIENHQSPCKLHNNCSGKHTGFLTSALHLGIDIHNYHLNEHKLQKEITHIIASMLGYNEHDFIIGVDGCSAPAIAMPMNLLAKAMAVFGCGYDLSDIRAKACQKIVQAILDEPFYIAGSKRACSDFIEASNRKIIVKMGAEGCYTGSIPHLGLGIVLKIDDGDKFAAECLMANILLQLDVIKDIEKIQKYLNPVLLNAVKDKVGNIQITDKFYQSFSGNLIRRVSPDFVLT